MRNAILAGLVFASTATVLVYQRAAVAEAREKIDALTERQRAIQAGLGMEHSRIKELEKRQKSHQTELALVREQVEEQKAGQRIINLEELRPQLEGHWPKERPYFYLAKKHIPSLGYDALNHSDGMLSRGAAAVFGMNAMEQRAVNDALRSVQESMRMQELREAYITNTPAFVEGQRRGEKISVFLPASLDLKTLEQEFVANVRSALGEERAAMFLQRARENQRQIESFSGKDRILTIIPKDDFSGEIIISTAGGTMFNYYDLTHEFDPMVVQYRHLLNQFALQAKPR